MNSEEKMRAEGRQIIRAMDNYEPLHTSRKEAQAQNTLQQHTQKEA